MNARIIHSENSTAMGDLAIGGERFELAYLDPPFFTGRTFTTSDGVFAYEDRWASLDAYLDALMLRATLAYSLLSDSGSLVIHVDPTVSHYVKVRGDAIFGRDNFASEIVWRYRRWPVKFSNFQRMHDVLLRWGTGRADPKFNQLYEPLAASTLATWGDKKQRAVVDGAGRRSRSSSGSEKTEGAPLSDVWEIGIIAPVAKERTGYPTQKPEALLERLLLALTNAGDRVLDPYMGSGTTLAAAERWGRHAVGIDSGDVAVRMARRRLEQTGSERARSKS